MSEQLCIRSRCPVFHLFTRDVNNFFIVGKLGGKDFFFSTRLSVTVDLDDSERNGCYSEMLYYRILEPGDASQRGTMAPEIRPGCEHNGMKNKANAL